MRIGNRDIGLDCKPFIIAEMSGNHNQSLDRALAIVKAAADCGVDAVKLQTYTPATMTLDSSSSDFFIEDKDSLWSSKRLWDLYQVAHTPWEWHKEIIEYSKSLGLICFSSPFDETAVDFLEELDVPAYKIASFENIHYPLIKKIASTNKPIILSTGLANLSELESALAVIRENGSGDVAYLKCTSTYPSNPSNSNISTIPHMRNLFDVEIGLSDHTMGVGVAVAAVSLGATIIEKHFTLDRAEGGVDSEFSLEPNELSSLVVETERAWQSLGCVKYGPTEAELKSSIFRRSIFISENLKAGEKLTLKNIRIVRPGTGLHPKFLDIILGRAVKVDVTVGTPLDWNLIGSDSGDDT